MSAAPGGAASAAIPAQGANVLVADAAPFSLAGVLAAGRAGGAAAIPPGESFRQIDTAAGPSRLLRTTATSFEVGVNDPAHGWVEVRADSVSGQVRASLSASSPEARSALHASLPEMAGYLAERDIGVRSLGVDHGAKEGGSFPDAGGGGQGRDFSGGADPNARGGRQPAEPSLSTAAEVADGENRPRSGDRFSENEIATRSVHGRGAAIGYSAHTINLLA